MGMQEYENREECCQFFPKSLCSGCEEVFAGEVGYVKNGVGKHRKVM